MRPARRQLPGLLAIVAATGAVALCGCDARTDDERLAAQRIEEFLAAMEAGDDARACATMTPKLRHAITTELRIESEEGTCRTRAADVYSPAKAPGNPDATVRAIEIAGDRATATVTANPTNELATGPVESVVLLERRERRWLVANF